ncbi:hypothetical protein [Ramlibacter sp.]|uniref:hypothetical protein n=1 Tax=Ramlibacter sp. TaxID=1917967 RepID=UPI002C2EB413|nr:hypothetical protein [Ramlibacter sp.]HWI83864.1 hypothetical protein [Ramlibacter sp.]
MFHPLRVLCLLACVASWSIPAAAGEVWRCGDTYSNQPCPGGKLVPAQDARSADQRAQTNQAVRRDAKVADEMEKARLKEEAKPVAAAIPSPREEPVPPAAADRTVSGAVAKKPAYFTAVSPRKAEASKSPKKKARKKARKAA